MARPTNALIADDEAHVRTFLRMLLKEVGIETTWEAGDGNTALALFAEHRPQLVLLDVNMPGVGGLDVLAKMSASDPDVPVVIVTAQSAMSTVKEAMRLGAAGYILKQNAKSEALAALRDVLEGMDDDEPAAP